MRRASSSLSVLVVWGWLAGVSLAAPAGVAQIEKRATARYRAGDYRGALRLLKRVLTIAPGPAVHRALAACYLKLGDDAAAVRHLRALLASGIRGAERKRARARLAQARARLRARRRRPAEKAGTPPAMPAGTANLRLDSAPAARTGLAAGLELAVLATGNVSASSDALGLSASTGLDATVALSPYLDYRLSRIFSVGFAPRFVFGESAEILNGSATEVDLTVRLRVGYPVHRRLHLHLLLAPGYALWLPSGGDASHGFHLGVAAGLTFAAWQGLGLLFQLGYRGTFVSITEQGEPVSLSIGALQIGFGAEYTF